MRDTLAEEVNFWLSAYIGAENRQKAQERILEMSPAMTQECREILIRCFGHKLRESYIPSESSFSCNSSRESRC